MVVPIVELGHGGAVYSFADWPNRGVPAFGAGVYTIWDRDSRFMYVGMSGRGMTAETVRRNTPQGIYTGSKAMPADAAVAISSAYTWRTDLSSRPWLRRISLQSLRGVTRWMHSCVDTSMRTCHIGSSWCRTAQRLTHLKRRSRAENGSMDARFSILGDEAQPVATNGVVKRKSISNVRRLPQYRQHRP